MYFNSLNDHQCLAAQLRLLPNVPIVAFGGKAQEVLRRLKVPAIKVPHPSARDTKESKRDKWERAIAELQSREDPCASAYTGAPRRWAQQRPDSGRQVHLRGTSRDRPQRPEGVVEKAKPDDLPSPVAAFLVAAVEAGYEVRWGNRQNKSLLYDGRWLGGWNYKAEHWCVRTSAVGERNSLPRQHGFEPRRNGTLWLRSGKTDAEGGDGRFSFCGQGTDGRHGPCFKMRYDLSRSHWQRG